MNKTENITACIRCGTCCRKGGPALHKEDKKILLEGHISYHHLITIRKGELAFTPLSSKPEPVKQELVKIAGKGKSWACLFYEKKQSSCAVYEKRPLECRLLKCWDTAQLLAIVGKDTLTRADIISADDPIMRFIRTHEKEC
ncbi:MAG: YkgJ family cysteine cluster protein, partial [Nitrospirota bacterium]